LKYLFTILAIIINNKYGSTQVAVDKDPLPVAKCKVQGMAKRKGLQSVSLQPL
jgi:hypothetical protein